MSNIQQAIAALKRGAETGNWHMIRNAIALLEAVPSVDVANIIPDIEEYDPTNESFDEYRKYVVETVLDALGVKYTQHAATTKEG